ncbi:MAG: hypothetical protein KH321_07830 [Clostridium sp.]|nr:hypothetical protein [Clostridium sp.]
MSLINNKFLSLTNRLQLQAQAKILQQEQQEEKKLEQQKQSETSLRSDESSTQTRAQSSSISDDLLLTYRGININHIETAQQKTVVTMDTLMPMLSNPQPVNIAPLEVKKEPKPATVSNSVINSSSIASQYNSGVVREGHRGLKTPSKLEAITDMARGDLNAVADAIKSELKAQMGSDYNEKEVQRAIDAAIEQTLKVFSDNEERRRTEAGVNDNAFIFKKKGGLFGIIGTYTYNVQALTNTFLSSYNEIATELFNDSQQEKAPGSIGKGVVVGSGVYTSYKENEKKSSTSMIKFKAMNDVKEMARADMSALTDTIREQLKGELGSGYNDSLVRASINEAIERTINQFAQNEGPGVENGFEYKRKSFFRSTCSYNVGNLIDSFIVNFNEINVVKFKNLSPVDNKEQKSEYTNEYINKYATQMTGEMLKANIDEAVKSAAGDNNVDSQLLYIKADSPQQLQSIVAQKIDNTYALYQERFGSAFNNKSELKALFEDAKNSVLNSLNDKNKCNLGEISYNLQDKFFENINTNLWNKYQAENAANRQPVTRSLFSTNTISSSSAATRGISSTGNVSVSTANIKFQDGIIITDPKNYPATIDITINNSDGTNSTIKVEVSPDLLVYKPLKENNDEVTVVDPFEDWNSKPLQDRINEIANNLKQTFENLPDNVLKDFISEGTNISINPSGDDIYSSKNLGLYSPAINEISLTYGPGHGTGFLNGINVNTLTHEIGHSIDVQEGVYKSDSATTDMSSVYNDFLNSLPSSMRDNYALKNPKEFFAEYYAYKNLGTSDHFASLMNDIKQQGLYDKVKPILEKIDKEFNGILKTDEALKQAQDKEQNGNFTNSELLDKIKKDWESGKIYTSDLVGNNWSDINDTWNLNMQTKDILAEYYKHYYLNEPSDLINRLNNATGNTKYGDSIKKLWDEAVNGSQYSDGIKQTCEAFKNSLKDSPNIYAPNPGGIPTVDQDHNEELFDDTILDNSYDDDNIDEPKVDDNLFEFPSDNNEQTDDFEPDNSNNESNDIETGTDSSDSSSDGSTNDSGVPDDVIPQPDSDNTPNDNSNENTPNNSLDFPDNAIVNDDGNIVIPSIKDDDTSNNNNLTDTGREDIGRPDIVTDEEKQQIKEQYEEKYGDEYEVNVLHDGTVWLKPKEDKDIETEDTNNNENNIQTDNNVQPDHSIDDTSDDTSIDVDDYFNDDGSFDTDDFIDDAVDSGWDHWEYDDPDDIEDIWGDIQDAEESNDWDNFWDDMYDDDDSWDSSWDDSWDDSYDDDNWWDT